MTLVPERFFLNKEVIKDITIGSDFSFGFNGFGELTYYRTYSRNGESWPETVERVVNGTFSIRKSHYISHNITWDEDYWQRTAASMFSFMFQLKFTPAGRGLWAMGTEHVFNIGSMALNNCAGTLVTDETFAEDISWSMDAMMLGCGVGYRLETTEKLRDQNYHYMPSSKYLTQFKYENYGDSPPFTYKIHDSREGWVESVRCLLYEKGNVKFDYSDIRLEGSQIKTFGGVSSGPAPLMILHRRIRAYINLFLYNKISPTRFSADVINAVGCCVVSGNVRRGAQILIGRMSDSEFLNIKEFPVNEDSKRITKINEQVWKYAKNYDSFNDCKNILTSLPDEVFLSDRPNICHLSNNSASLESPRDFLSVGKLAKNILFKGEPGLINLHNIQNFSRVRPGGELEYDAATILNPCAEIPLEDKELCNLVEVFPTLCNSNDERRKALRLATLYAQTVSLLPTHSKDTNAVIERNRRIGVSQTGISEWLSNVGAFNLTRLIRDDYAIVRETANALAAESNVVKPIRVTTLKPSGTISQLAGVTSGMHFPTFQYAIRRIRMSKDSLLTKTLKRSGVLSEPDVTDSNTTIFSYPIYHGHVRPATEVSAWEQFALLSMLQREWADNSVSCTIYFNPETEGKQLEFMLGQFLPLIKSVSLLPHTKEGAYAQMPYEGITKEIYEEMRKTLKTVNWEEYREEAKQENDNATNLNILYCDNDLCEVP